MTIPTGLRGTNGQSAAPPYTNGPYTWDQNLTLSGEITLSGLFQSQILLCNAMEAIDTDWTIQTNGGFKIASNKGAKALMIPINAKVGDEIVGYRVIGGLSGATGLDANVESILYRSPKTAGSAVTAPTQIARATIVTANTVAGVALDNGSALTTVHTVLADNQYFIVVSATTDNDGAVGALVLGAEVDVNRK